MDYYHFQNIIVTGDHRTPVGSGTHESGTVPLLFLKRTKTKSNAQHAQFSEESCAGKPTVYGKQLLDFLLQ